MIKQVSQLKIITRLSKVRIISEGDITVSRLREYLILDTRNLDKHINNMLLKQQTLFLVR